MAPNMISFCWMLYWNKKKKRQLLAQFVWLREKVFAFCKCPYLTYIH